MDLQLKRLVPQLSGKKVLVIGDLMLDEHIWSRVHRISPEAPVPIADVSRITHVPGGCGNVASNIKALSGTPLLLGIMGRDSSAEKLKKALKHSGISVKHIIQTSERPTILKSRILAASQQVVRVDREDRTELSKGLLNKVIRSATKLIKEADAVVLSDYGKGLLSKELCKKVVKLAKKKRIPVAVDPKGLDYSKYKGVTIITPNQHEAELSTGIKITNKASLLKTGKALLKAAQSPYALITRGKDGMTLFLRTGAAQHVQAIEREVFDITGAGDTVIAALTLALAAKAQVFDAVQLANQAASVAVSKIGTQPVFADELEESLEEKEPAGKKIKSRADLAKIMKKLKAEGARIVFTNGCFDILHLGHVRYLKEAKKLGDILVVGLNSDSSVKRLKGWRRPYISELERAEILASLECVDYVTIFSETRPDNLIGLVRPEVHVKGGDYKPHELPERKLVKSLGGRVKVIPPIKGRSTTSLIEKIMERKK